MKSNFFFVSLFLTAAISPVPKILAQPKAVDIQSAWDKYRLETFADRSLVFDIFSTGKKTPILWGFDTAWNDYGNMLRGVRHCGRDAVSCARVSFQPWAEITEKGVLPEMLQKNLDKRMETVGIIGKKVDIVLNLDGGDPTIKEIYGGWKYENPDDPWWSPKEYIGNVVDQGPKWADLIDATAAAVEAKGYKVITASPLNEPDLEINGTPIELFYEISKNLKDFDKYPRFRDIRISGGNTLNDDEAMKWYEYNKEFLDEGNTHQLAGSFDNYASFFAKVRQDGKHATADELHNVMEAIVGVEYGMQTGIWWGTAEQCRGEFMKASFGERLSYAENRDAWSAGAVYRSPSGKIQGFLGCSERQAKPSSYRFVSLSGDVFMDGFGPVREFTVNLPGDPNGAYQSDKQRTAETMITIENGEDVRPYINGEYALINAADHKAASAENASTGDGSYIVSETFAKAEHQLWSVTPVPNDNGGDFSYYFIRTKDGKSMDDYGWNIEVGAPVRLYGHSGNAVQQWALEYDGDNWFHIRSRNSGLYLEYESGAAGGHLVQKERTDEPSQKWRLLSSEAPLEFNAPLAPEGLKTLSGSASVTIEWKPVADDGEVTYTILRAEEGSDKYITIARDLESTSFLDNSVDNKPYRYKVFAMDASGNRSATSTSVPGNVAGGKELVANYPLTGDLNDTSGNRFSMKTDSDVSFISNSLNTRGKYYQLPYSLLCHENFTVMMRALRSSAVDGLILFSTGVGEDDCMELSLSNGGSITLAASNARGNDVISTTEAPFRTRVHIAVTVEDGHASLYVDGKAVGSGLDGYIPTERLLNYIGRGQKATNNYFSGLISDLRVYNYALSASDIAGIALDGSGVGEILTSSSIVAVEYYSPQGTRLSEPADSGVTIVRTYYSDGFVVTRKIVK